MVRVMFEKDALDRIMKMKSDYIDLQKKHEILMSEYSLLLKQQSKLIVNILELKKYMTDYIIHENPNLICVYDGHYRIVLREPFDDILKSGSHLDYVDFRSSLKLRNIVDRVSNSMRLYVDNESLYNVIVKINEEELT